MKKIIFKIGIMILTILLIFGISAISQARVFKPEDFKKVTEPNMSGNFILFGGEIIYIIQYVGYAVAVLTLLGIGIKYMMSAPNEKADLKSRLIPYIIGCLLLFGGVSIMSLIYDIVKK